MRIADFIQETLSALSGNKARSGLTMLGIIIGIASVIAMVSIGQGTQGTIQSSIEGLGSNLLTVSPGFSQSNRGAVSAGRGSSQSLTLEDADALSKIPGVAAVSPELQSRSQITAKTGNNTNASVIGVVPDYQVARNLNLASGSFIGDNHVSSIGRVVVLGATVATDLFGEDYAVGQTIRINRTDLKVIGVLEAKGGSGFFSQDEMVMVPLTTVQKIISGRDYLSSIAISVGDKDQMAEIQQLATDELVLRHKVDPASPDFSIVSQADILGTLNQITFTFTLLLASIAGISLLVGGIGIMNMMLTTVTERIKEIGLRRSIGARRGDISAQFLAEAVMLTVVGGIIGVFIGWLASIVVTKLAGIATSVSLSSVLLAFGVSAAIGIIFGFYPARRAARLNPIEALRYE